VTTVRILLPQRYSGGGGGGAGTVPADLPEGNVSQSGSRASRIGAFPFASEGGSASDFSISGDGESPGIKIDSRVDFAVPGCLEGLEGLGCE
jgi:hypothetical protein